MIEIDTTALSFLFAVFGTFYSLLLVAVLYARHRGRAPEGVSTDSRFSLMIPARNEESVLARTIEGILAMDYPKENVEVLIIDGGSADRTSDIAARFAAEHPGRVAVIRVREAKAGRGK
ncbi:MAG: glycosyltransferase, partial [Methanobacteriota archaeon]